MFIKRGAEAEIRVVEWYGKRAISKMRLSTPYRNSILDNAIRKQRTLHEAKMIHEAKKAGVTTPLIYFLDPKNAEIIMQYIDGVLLKSILDKNIELSRIMGEQVGRLHKYDIVHGDLTTSNFLLYNNRLVLIDFGLAFKSNRLEDKAVDIRLIKEVLSSAHATIFDEALQLFIEGYSQFIDTEQILKKVREIEQRGRYARVV